MTSKRKVFALRLQVDFDKDRTIGAIYGVRAKDQSSVSICALLQEAGFETQVLIDQKHWFLIKAKAHCHDAYEIGVREHAEEART
jgi:hypothetical protein